MSVYKSDVPEFVQVALDSIINQTLVPDEIVLIADGPIPDALRDVIEATKARFPALNPIYQAENKGLGEALRVAVENAQYDYIARMDSDDISLTDRFEKQMKCFDEDETLSVVGGMITEFVDEPTNITGKRILPLDDKSIKKFMRSRCGVNHVTVIFKKSDLLAAGNYQPWYHNEDYYLWARMMERDFKFKNIQDIVVNVRAGKDQYARRGGMKYYKSQSKTFYYMYRRGLISLPRLLYNYIVRGVVQFAMPNGLRTFVYQNMLRKK